MAADSSRPEGDDQVVSDEKLVPHLLQGDAGTCQRASVRQRAVSAARYVRETVLIAVGSVLAGRVTSCYLRQH